MIGALIVAVTGYVLWRWRSGHRGRRRAEHRAALHQGSIMSEISGRYPRGRTRSRRGYVG